MDYSQAAENIEKTLTIIAIVVGGVISWVKFVGGRADKIRLEPVVSCEPIYENEITRVVVTMQLNNKGLFAAEVPTRGFTLEVSAPKPDLPTLEVQTTHWEPITVFYVFANHNAIQTGETAQEQLRISVDNARFTILQLKLRVTHQGRKWMFFTLRQGTEWEATTIVDCRMQQNPSL